MFPSYKDVKQNIIEICGKMCAFAWTANYIFRLPRSFNTETSYLKCYGRNLISRNRMFGSIDDREWHLINNNRMQVKTGSSSPKIPILETA